MCWDQKSLSVQFHSHSVMSDSLWPHQLQPTRPPCPSPAPGVHPNLCPSSWWCHPTMSSSVVPFSFCLQYFPESGCFPKSHSSHEVAKILEFLLQHQSFWRTPRTYFLYNWLIWSCRPKDSLQSSPTPQFKSINSLAFFIDQLSHPYMTTGNQTNKKQQQQQHSFD